MTPAARRTGSAAALVRGWALLAAVVAAKAYRALLLTLLATALLPAAAQWTPYVVRSGSMEPALGVGDVVVAIPWDRADAEPLGRVVVFTPAGEPHGEPTVHRIVAARDDGTWTTAGDANAATDTTPLTADRVRGRAAVLVPYVGLPYVWATRGQHLPVLAWAAVTAGALALARGPAPRHRRRRGGRARAVRPVVAATVAAGLVAAAVPALHDTTARAAFTATTGGRGSWQTTRPLQRYSATVLADRPLAYYLLDEAGGTTAVDRSGQSWHGVYASVAAYRRPGALPNNLGHAVELGGGQDRLVSGGAPTANPTTYSIELWFRTATTSGGKIVGFESTQALSSPQADRHLFMRDDGRLVYGGWPSAGGTTTLVTPLPYNDGRWHHLVVTASVAAGVHTAVLYVDGAVVRSGPVTPVGSYAGWWRVGYGTLPAGDGYPGTAGFEGEVDQVAGYWQALSAARVRAHYDAR